jgi:hypothetical protein
LAKVVVGQRARRRFSAWASATSAEYNRDPTFMAVDLLWHRVNRTATIGR